MYYARHTSSLSQGKKTGLKGQKMKITDAALELHKFINEMDISDNNKIKIHIKIVELITKLFIDEISESKNNNE